MKKNHGYGVIIVMELLICCCIFSSCSKKEKNSNQVLWGKAKTYSDFLFCKKAPLHFCKTLKTDFNDNAKLLCNPVKLELCESDQDGNYKPLSKGIQLYQDGKIAQNNEVGLLPGKTDTKIDLVVSNKLADGYHNYVLRVVDSGGLDRIGDIDITPENRTLDSTWVIQKTSGINPLLAGLIIFIILAIVCILIWILAIVPSRYPRIKVRNLYISYPEGKTVPSKIYGYYRVYFFDKPHKKQGFINRLFTGKRLFLNHPFWKGDQCSYISKAGRRNKISLHASSEFSPRSVQLSSQMSSVTVTKIDSEDQIIINIK